jgi:hypothetical protein
MTISMLGRYQIVSQLGKGAMGTVYRAVDPAIERTVAIKILNSNLADENMGEVKERFLREAKSAGRLNHPNVVTIYDVGEAGGIAYIAMEYLEGRSLRQVLDSGTSLPLHVISDIVAQIADALDYAQRSGIVHRDIKPANIMLSSAGVAKLADFGIASMPSSSMTQTGAMLGSPKYMSPEQVLGQPVDGRSDIFSLGVVLYEMLARRTPFELPDITTFSLMQRIVTVPAPRFSELGMDVPAAFDLILAQALAKRPDDRFQRAIEFANGLRNYNRSAGAAVTVIATPVEDTLLVRRALDDTLADTQPPRDDAAEQEKMARLLDDLEVFSQNFEKEEERRRAEMAAARAAAEAAARAEAEEERQKQDAAAASRAKSALIDILQRQAQAKAQQRPGQPSPESVRALDSKLRKAFNYLVEFVRLLNDVSPAFNGKLTLIYVGSLPAATVGNALVNYRMKKVEDFEAIDHIALSYRMSSEQKVRISLNQAEARALKAQMDRSRIKYEEREEKKDYGKVPRIAIAIEGNIPANATLRADYGAFAIRFECFNVGQIGIANYQIGADQLDEATIEEFGKLILGFPSRFQEFRQSTGVS